MRQLLFAIRDGKADAFMPPFCAGTRGLAVRHFGDALRDPEGPFVKHPEDYSLFVLGEFQVSSGVITPLVPELVITGLDAKGE